ncbi:serine hydrolase [Patescibacteria group bacterium]|nr:serine hydrolase [Patescibacteria group bacterium]MBU1755092.1 serine hydrolase [Patescibacteria group bacterium]
MDWRKAVTAVLAGIVVLGALYLFMPRPEKPVAVEEPVRAPAIDPFARVSVQGKAAIVYDLTTGDVLYAKNPDAQLPLASLTKLITVYSALEYLSPQYPIVVTEDALATEGDSGMILGERFSLQNAAKLALVASSNDISEAIALTVEGVRSLSTRQLSATLAQSMGLNQTYALNGTGLDESTTTAGGYGSARDIAKLAGALVEKAPEIAEATTHTAITAATLEGTMHTLSNTNHGIRHVPGALLSKTGFTDLAGGNLVVVYDTGINHPVAVVVLGSTIEGRFTDVERLTNATMLYFSSL